MGNFLNNIRSIIQQSSVVNHSEPLRSEVLNARYQSLIDERIYSYRDPILEATRMQGAASESEINRMYSLSPKEYTKEMREGFSAALEEMIPQNQKELMKRLGESTTYSGIYFGEIITGNKSNEVASMIQNLSDPSKSDAVLLRKNNSAFLFAHGSQEGKIVFQGKTYAPKDLIGKMYDKNLIPEDIDNLFTINCYGGKQSSFIGPGGVKVKSLHTSKNPILGFAMGGAALGNTDPMFMLSLTNGDIIDEAKELLSKDGDFEVMYTAAEINDALGVKQKSVWGEPKIVGTEIVNDFDADIYDNIEVTVETISVDDVGDIDKYIEEEIKKMSEGGLVSRNIENTSDAMVKSLKSNKASKLSRKKLNGKGKLAAGLNIASAIAGIATNTASASKSLNKSSKSINKKAKTTAQKIDNSYAIQMAQDISSYRYGKHMTGFVNF